MVPGPRLVAADLVELHGRCGQQFAALVAGVGRDQWHHDTPCSQWDVRALVHHLLYEQRWVPPLLDGVTVEQVGDRFEGDLLGNDASAWPGLLASSIDVDWASCPDSDIAPWHGIHHGKAEVPNFFKALAENRVLARHSGAMPGLAGDRPCRPPGRRLPRPGGGPAPGRRRSR